MISRFLSETEAVHCFDQQNFHSCTVAGFACSCGPVSTGGAFPFSYSGRIIDRLGLAQNFNAVKPVVSAYGDALSSAESTAMFQYMAVGIGLQHSATTCMPDFADYSTGDWITNQALQVVTTATTTGGLYSAEGAKVSTPVAGTMTSAATSSTSTAYAALSTYSPQAFALAGASRYLRVIIAPTVVTTGCGGSNMKVQAALLFGHPGETPTTAPRGRVFVTSACSS